MTDAPKVRSYRALWIMGTVCGILIAGTVLLYTPGRREYTSILPPDTVHLRSPVIDSIGRAIARCFEQPEYVTKEILWFTSDSSLGRNRSGKELGGRWYAEARAVVIATRRVGDLVLYDHEWRHPVTKELHTEWEQNSATFQKVCR